MLLVKVYIDKSSIHGLGVFAAEQVPSGSEVWRFTEGFDLDLDPGLLENKPPTVLEWLLHYGYIDSRLNRFILCCDHARFINHSDTPNIVTDYTACKYGVDYAVRDITQGEEITTDYTTFEGNGRTDRFPRVTGYY